MGHLRVPIGNMDFGEIVEIEHSNRVPCQTTPIFRLFSKGACKPRAAYGLRGGTCENGVFVVMTCLVFLGPESVCNCRRHPFSSGRVCLVLSEHGCTLSAGRSRGLCPAFGLRLVIEGGLSPLSEERVFAFLHTHIIE